jgi:hypothetical protein
VPSGKDSADRLRKDYYQAFWKPRHEEDEILGRLCEASSSDALYITYLGSDDLLRDDAIGVIQSVPIQDETQAIVPQQGYLFGSVRWRMCPVQRVSPPVFTLVYRRDEYFAGRRHYGGRGRHLEVSRRLRCQIVRERIFALHLHGRNDSSRFPARAPPLSVLEMTACLERFGVASRRR